jgi:FixJ family two-component response regulator
MALVVRGLSNKQIAAELVTEEKPLKFIEAGSCARCKHRTLADLVRMAERLESFFSVALAAERPIQKRAEP